jgi:hypothetical protein
MANEETDALFFGDTPHSAGWRGTINAQGFASSIADYRSEDPTRTVVAVFGGSVSDLFANVVQAELKPDLAEALGVDAQSIDVLNFAMGGYKQPQQVIALIEAMLLRIPIRMVVELDGFNETAMGGMDCARGLHPIFPSTMHYLTLLDVLMRDPSVETMHREVEIHALRERGQRLRGVFAGSWLARWETAKAALGTLALRADTAARDLESHLQEASALQHSLPVVDMRDSGLAGGESCAEVIGDVWLQSSLLMADLAHRLNVPYVHVLQPNQYVSDAKPLSADERRTAWRPDGMWARRAAEGYPVLRRRSAELVRQGVTFADLSDAFAGQEETLYVDQCCHFNFRGNRILAERLFPLIGRAFREHRATVDRN